MVDMGGGAVNKHDGVDQTLDAKSDRMMLRSEFLAIEGMMPGPFTLDGACNANGDNAHVSTYCSSSDSFLDRDVGGHRVWLNPPYARISQFLKHYLLCKSKRPADTSMCVVLPAWKGKHRKLLQGMQLIATYPKGTRLFTAPSHDGQRTLLPGTPWPVEVWYDAPGTVRSADLHVAGPAEGVTFLFRGKVAGCLARFMLDSGASHCFISAEEVARRGLRVVPAVQAQVVRTAGGHSAALLGQCTFKVNVQQFSGTVTTLVLQNMLPETDVILGDEWLRKQQAVMNYNAGTCTLHSGSRIRTLRVGHDDLPNTSDQILHQLLTAVLQAQAPPAIVTAKQAHKAMKRGAAYFTVMVKRSGDVDLQPGSANTMMCAPKCVRAVPLDPTQATCAATSSGPAVQGASAHSQAKLQQLLQQYSNVFADLPPELPPERNVAFTIPLQPGATPPARRMYRLSPKELEEVKRQITELLKKGFIEPSSSPFGAPILFVAKKDGSLRMVIDYRQLNKITVKNKYPLPRIEDLYDSLLGAKVYSSLDLQQGYNQIRIAPEDVPKTGFITPVGSYQFKVLSFGLTNSPAIFQKAMNDVFGQYIGKFVAIYLDDILVYSKTEAEHVDHLQKVLQLLSDNKLYAKMSKCEFFKPQLQFLGHVVSQDGLQVDPSKVDVVNNWQVPTTIKELRSFLGLANYFRKYVQGYSSLVAPLIQLTKLDKNFKAADWQEEHQSAFDGVKRVLTTAPVLALPDPSVPFEVISDASVNGTGAVLMQNKRVCAYHSKKFTPAERNYTTTEQEMLGVLHALQEWRCYLEGGPESVLVTDHNPLVYLQEQPHLSRRQARWMEFFSRFNYRWQYRPGRINVADPLSRNPAFLNVMTRGQKARENAPATVAAPVPPPPPPLPRVRDTERPAKRQRAAQAVPAQPVHNTPVAAQSTPHVGNNSAGTLSQPLMDAILQGYAEDEWFSVKRRTKKLSRDATGLWRKGDKVVVPNVKLLKQAIMREAHDAKYSGHVGRIRTLELVERTFWWPGVTNDVREYVQTCDVCQRNKVLQRKPAGLLQPLPIPKGRWESVSMDLITSLPKTRQGHDAIVVMVDRLTKMTHFVAVKGTITAKELADVFYNTVFKLHGMPTSIVSDRDSKFTSMFWQQLMARVGTVLRMSTAYHPQTDGQTERMNRVLEDMLRNYVDPTHNDWDEHLAGAEFAVNNAYHAGIASTPFFLNNGEHPPTPLSLSIQNGNSPAAKQFADGVLHDVRAAREKLQQAQQRQARFANKKRRHVAYLQGDEVMLSTVNIRLKAVGSPKLLPRWIGPFSISQVISPLAYRLELPDEWSIHNVFHVSLLKPYLRSERTQPLPQPLRFEDGEPVFVVERVLDHKDVKRGKRTVRHFLIKWEHFTAEHNTWEPEKNLLNCKESIADYWARK
jgi:hypothetical protein